MKPRIAVIGANGQVGAELCLALHNFSNLSVVPIIRARRGSSYLRWKGLACRHGSLTHAQSAQGLIGDCDLILNLALPSGRPREVRKENRDIIENCARYAKAGARIVYFSTQSVYGAAGPQHWIRWRNGYGLEKLRGENDARRSAKRHQKALWVLRLGHVCGDLQSISLQMRQDLQNGAVHLARGGEVLSNCTQIATIVASALALLGECDPPGTYDLMDAPHRTWREIYAWEAQCAGVTAHIRSIPARTPPRLSEFFRTLISAPLRGRAGNPVVHEMGLKFLAMLPEKWGAALQARYFQKRAAGEIAALQASVRSQDACDWQAVPGPFFLTGIDTDAALRDPRYRIPLTPSQPPFPEDLPLAHAGPG